MDETRQELDKCEDEFEDTCKKADEVQAQVDESNKKLTEKREALCVNMRDNYKLGLSNMIDFLLGSKSFEDLVGRIYYLDKIGDARAAEIQEVNRLAEELATRQKKLEKTKDRLQTDAESYEAKMIQYQEMTYEAQEYRDGLSEEVRKVIEEEEAARKAEEEAARKKAEEEAAKKKAEEEEARKDEGEDKDKDEGEETPQEEQKPEEEATEKPADEGNDNSETQETSDNNPTTVSPVHQPTPGDPDKLIYIQWGARQQACWPIKGGSRSMKVDCGAMTLMHSVILLTGDYSLTPDGILAAMEAKYGTFSASQTYNNILRYAGETYGIHYSHVGHLTAKQAKAKLREGHVISAGGGCEGRDGLPFCKEPGVKPRCTYGHVVLFYKYSDGIFWAKDSSGIDGAAMCAYPDGPLTITHKDSRCSHNGQTVSFDNYADAFLRNSWNVELWI